MTAPSFNRHVIQPIECLKSGWEIVKDRYWLFAGVTAVAMLIGSMVPLGILMGPMMCGMYLVYFQHIRRQPIEFGMLFKGFDYFLESLIATLVQFVPIALLMVPCYLAFFAGMLSFMRHQRSGNPPAPGEMLVFVGSSLLLGLIALLVMILVGVLFSFTYPLIVDRKLSGIQALKSSMKAGLANIWGLLGLLLLNGILVMAGTACCYIGAFLVMPISFGAISAAYRQVFGLAEAAPASPLSPPAPPPVA